MAKGKVLVADDEADIREVLQRALTRAGYDVDTAENGVEALKKVLGRKNGDTYIATITDNRMAGGWGIDFLEAVKKVRPDAFVMIGSGTWEDEERARVEPLVGRENVLCKPYTLRDVVARVNLLAAFYAEGNAVPYSVDLSLNL